MEEPARRLLIPDEGWLTLETSQPTQFPAEPIISPKMEHLDQRRTRPKIPIQVEILPVSKHRMMISMPELAAECQNDARILNTMGDALTFLTKTGSKKDIRRSLAALAILHVLHPTQVRNGRPSARTSLGDQMVCIDYSSQTVSVGEMSWAIVGRGENLPIGGKCAWHYLNGGTERYQCVALHLAAAYEWAPPQWRPRRPPSFSRIQTVGPKLTKSEYQPASLRMEMSADPT